MSSGEEEPAEEEPEDGAASLDDQLEAAMADLEGEDPQEAIAAAIESLGSAVEAADTETDLDRVEAAVEEVATAIEDADLPEPDDEDDEDPRAALESELDDVRESIEATRGPYAADVIESLEAARSEIDGTRWTEDGESQLVAAVSTAMDTIGEVLDEGVDAPADVDGIDDALSAAGEAIEAADLDPDDDAEPIADLVDAADALTAAIEDAEAWSDLTTREQLQAEGFYDVLEHRKDYPPEWHAIKEWEQRGNADMILLALEKLGSEFMEEHCLAALGRLGPEAALDPMLERAARRDQPAIRILGKIASDEAVETIVEYLGTDSDPALEQVTLKALGEIGSTEATHAVAQRLTAENDEVRSAAARSLGLIGDPRAVEPLAALLESDAADPVRASAAWALVQVGTVSALEAAAAHTDDPAYLVQAEAEQAAAALGAVEA